MKSIDQYSDIEIKKFDRMHEALKAYNQSIGSDNELPIPNFSDDEMMEYSRYRELLIANECEETDF